MKLLKHLLLLLLAFPLGSLTSGQSLAENDPSLSGNPPKLDVGITTCDDGSRWHGFVFQTIAGLPYVVESGDDLAGWTEVDTFYGLGQEQVVLMKQAPALPASSPSPSGPITPHPLVVRVPNAQVIMRRAIGGGTILSWRSLDDDSSRSHFFPTLIQDAGWNIMPGYTRRLGGYNFLICNPLVPQTPPTDSPTLGPKDTAMVTAFEASFEEMNADAAAAIARRRATPYVPSPPQEKRFWRVRVNWSLDSDLDGTPDWMEFAQLFAAGAGTNTVAGPEADPFNKDANHDGIPDGSQRSSDGDSINDDVDADKMDELIDWRKCPESRYAFFQVTPPEPAAGADYPPPPMGINNFGGILFQPGLWQAGVYSPLGNSATALAMNDVGNIISYRVVDGAAKTFWQHGISQTPVEVISGDFSASARFGIDDHAHVGQPFMDSFTPDGRFIVKTYEQTVENSWNIYERRLWRVDPASGAMSQSAIGPYFNFVQDPGYTWGYDLDAPMSLNGVSTPAGLQENRPPSHVTIMTSGTPLLSGNSDGEGEIRVLKNGMWQKPKNLKSATDVSPEGIVIHDGGVTPVWMNGFHRPLFALAPGLPGDFSSEMRLRDITQDGCILGWNGYQDSRSRMMAGLPIYVESLQIGNFLPAQGVDNFSVRTLNTHKTQDKLWVMVPINGSKSCFFRSPASTASPLKLSAQGLEVNGETEAIINTPLAPISFAAPAAAVSGTEVDLDIKLNSGASSLSKPIALKLMKHREVKISLIPVVLSVPSANGGQPTLYIPDLSPSAVGLKTYLDQVFEPQINVNFEVVEEDAISAQWDLNNNGYMDIRSDPGIAGPPPSDEQNEILMLSPPLEKLHIRVFIMGCKAPGSGSLFGQTAVGTAQQGSNAVWLVGNQLTSSYTNYRQLVTLSHEIGHIFFGPGHPDQGTGADPLPPMVLGDGTDHLLRLMVSGDEPSGSPERLIVKGEWDKAEIWLDAQEKTPQ